MTDLSEGRDAPYRTTGASLPSPSRRRRPRERGRPVGAGERAGRVAMVTEFYYPHLGGICEHVHFLSAELRRRGWTVDIITGAIPDADGYPDVVRLGRSVSVYANGSHARVTVGRRLREQVRSTLREGRYDVVHVHSPLAPSLPILAVQEADAPVVGTFHTPLGRNLVYSLGRRYFQGIMDRLSTAIAVSPPAAADFDRYFQTEWKIIPNGVDVDRFRPDASLPAMLEDGVPTLLFLGRLDPRNHLGTALKAFFHLQADLPGPLRMVVVGGGPLRRYYQRKARAHDNVHFIGPVLEGRPGYYAGSTVYLCPTTRATFGITLLEAMGCGTPVVCSDLPAFHHVAREGREALFAPMRDPAALARVVRTLLEDDALRERMSTAGRARALEFSWSRVTDRILEVYTGVASASTG